MDKSNCKTDLPAKNISQVSRGEEDEIDLLELIGIMWVHKWWIIGITGFAALAVIIYTIFSSSAFTSNWRPAEKYTSTAVVLVNEASGRGSLESLFEGRTNVSSLLKSSSLLISYGVLAEEILNESSTRNELLRYFEDSELELSEGNLSAEYDDETGLLRISYTSTNSVRAKEAANSAYKFIQNRFNNSFNNNLGEEIKNLEKKLEEVKTEFLRLEYRLGDFQKLYGDALSKLSESDIEVYNKINLEHNIAINLLEYLPQILLTTSIKNENEVPIFILLKEAAVSSIPNKSKYSGNTFIIVFIFAAFFLSVFFVFILHAINNIRKDPDKMRKLKGK